MRDRARNVDDGLLREWCQRWIGSEPARVLFRKGHLSDVLGLELRDGSRAVVKIRPPEPRVAGCVAVQRRLYERGYPCPQPIAGPSPLGDAMATAESLVPGGAEHPHAGEAHAALAALLADLVRLSPSPSRVPSLEPNPPWVGWDHREPGTWPRPDDLHADLNHHPGPAWIDEIGTRVRARLARVDAPPVIGHVDWEQHNVRWRDGRPYVVDDWDSVGVLCEQAIVGTAATVYPASADGRVSAATIEQTEAFLRSYQRARGVSWTRDEEEVCWAAGLWVIAFNARKESLGGRGGSVAHLRREAGERLRRGGA